MKPLSIKLQLSLMVSFLTLVIITVLSIVAYIEFEESLLGNIDATLRAMAEGIRAELDEEGAAERIVKPNSGPSRGTARRNTPVSVASGWRNARRTCSPAMQPAIHWRKGFFTHPPKNSLTWAISACSISPAMQGSRRKHMLRVMWMRQRLASRDCEHPRGPLQQLRLP